MSSPSICFARQFAGVVIAALIPVVLTAFLTIPFNLGGHPGEIRSAAVPTAEHAT
ncbi:MAG: hypothetical protein ABI702_05230 [Burkholderiales bacterium]